MNLSVGIMLFLSDVRCDKYLKLPLLLTLLLILGYEILSWRKGTKNKKKKDITLNVFFG